MPMKASTRCLNTSGWSICEGDCATLEWWVFPGAEQVCGDGLNNDCLDPSWPDDLTEIDRACPAEHGQLPLPGDNQVDP